jgi:peptide/nickel transport system ATP-binding protein
MVMYAGRVVEEAPVGPLFKDPLHPYTEGLLGATPRMHADAEDGARQRLVDIPGTVPLPDKLPPGCAFAPRCLFVDTACMRADPAEERLGPDHAVCCIRARETLAA